jgi:hypothetical protein
MNSHIILAALRCYQRFVGTIPEIDNLITDEGFDLPTVEEIDLLCEELNQEEEEESECTACNDNSCPWCREEARLRDVP